MCYLNKLENARYNDKDRTLHVSDIISVHYQKSNTVHTAKVYVIQAMLCVQC